MHQAKDIPDLYKTLENNLSDPPGWALYRLPGADAAVFVSGPVLRTGIADNLGNGFIISPFYDGAANAILIERLIYADVPYQDISHLSGLPLFYAADLEENTSKENYCGLVADVLAAIKKGSMQKAVPARTRHINIPRGFEPVKLFHTLVKAYPRAFVYLLSTPGTGAWLGSTPELLFRGSHEHIHTLSLAATRKTGAPEGEDINSKELEEHEIVTGYIENILGRFSGSITKQGPAWQQAGNVSHLATQFSASLHREYAGKYGALVRELHPTPAVCGYPLKPSLKLLQAKEHFNRQLYSGFLGPVSATEAALYVNLRCMQLYKNTASLYAGAGVVPGSDPEKEWQETEEKMQTLGQFLK